MARLTFHPNIEPIFGPRRSPLVLLSLNRNLHTMTIDKGINTKLQMHSLSINNHLPRLRMDPVKSDKALEIWLNTLRFTAPNIDTELHKTRGVQLMKLKVKPFQHANNKRVR